MLPMIYGKHLPLGECIVLEQNTYQGYEYVVVSYGGHPCAYVRIPENHPLYNDVVNDGHDYLNISCHGGLTFDGTPICVTDGYWIGWDYAHYGDYIGYADTTFNVESKKWSTEEMIDECIDVIGQLMEYEG